MLFSLTYGENAFRGFAAQPSVSFTLSGIGPSPMCRCFPRLKSQMRPKQRKIRTGCKSDYAPSASDEDILQKPGKEPLELEDVTHVFGYSRDIFKKYEMGEIIGSGSYGIVKKCVEKATGKRKRT